MHVDTILRVSPSAKPEEKEILEFTPNFFLVRTFVNGHSLAVSVLVTNGPELLGPMTPA